MKTRSLDYISTSVVVNQSEAVFEIQKPFNPNPLINVILGRSVTAHYKVKLSLAEVGSEVGNKTTQEYISVVIFNDFLLLTHRTRKIFEVSSVKYSREQLLSRGLMQENTTTLFLPLKLTLDGSGWIEMVPTKN